MRFTPDTPEKRGSFGSCSTQHGPLPWPQIRAVCLMDTGCRSRRFSHDSITTTKVYVKSRIVKPVEINSRDLGLDRALREAKARKKAGAK